jgi:hypothetical protein
MRLTLSDECTAARNAALHSYSHPVGTVVRFARALDCLPAFVDWTMFLGLMADGTCVWVDFDESPGNVVPVRTLLDMSLLLTGLRQVAGMADLQPAWPQGRTACTSCGGTGRRPFSRGQEAVVCECGGLGWIAESPDELGAEAP